MALSAGDLRGLCHHLDRGALSLYVWDRRNNIMGALYKGFIATAVIFGRRCSMAADPDERFGMATSRHDAGDEQYLHRHMSLIWCGVLGLIVDHGHDHLGSPNTTRAPATARSARSRRLRITGHGTNVIQGLAVSLEATAASGAS